MAINCRNQGSWQRKKELSTADDKAVDSRKVDDQQQKTKELSAEDVSEIKFKHKPLCNLYKHVIFKLRKQQTINMNCPENKQNKLKHKIQANLYNREPYQGSYDSWSIVLNHFLTTFTTYTQCANDHSDYSIRQTTFPHIFIRLNKIKINTGILKWCQATVSNYNTFTSWFQVIHS